MRITTASGSALPRQLSTIGRDERALVRDMFRRRYMEHMHVWGDVKHYTARLFFRRARHDAHASYQCVLPQRVQKFIDGTPVPSGYLSTVARLVRGAAEAEEVLGVDQLDKGV